MFGIELPVSIYTTKTPIDVCRFNVRSSISFFLAFSVNDRYQLNYCICIRLQCRDNYFFKIKFVFFLYLLLSASWKKTDMPLYNYDIRQIVGYRTPVFIQPFLWRLHITITQCTYNIPHLQLWYADVIA